MENVVAFNTELSGLYDTKPPISKAKMAAITKSAMRAIKFYKHVVQSVEKFILKCRPEYKVPGLYVIDSIVRQSRHQFGTEKDVFAPRFARNIKETFANLFRCAPEDKSRIIRVLNLWQKNNVFAPDVIQPLFDLADPNHPIYQMAGPGGSNAAGGGGGGINLGDISSTSNGLNSTLGGMDMSMSSLPGGADDKMMPDLSSMSHEKAQNVLDASSLRQLEHMQHYLKRQTANAAAATSTSASATKSSIAAATRDHHSYQCCGASDEMNVAGGCGGGGGAGVSASCCSGGGVCGGGGGGGGHACCSALPPVGTAVKPMHRHHSGDSFSKYPPNDGHHHHAHHHHQQQQQQQHRHSHSHTHSHPHMHAHHHRGGSGIERDYRDGNAVGDVDSDGGGGHAAVDDDDDDVMETNSSPPPPPLPPPLPPHTSSTSNLLDNNNLKQLLNDPNVLMQLKTLQNFQKFKQQEDNKYKSNDMRLQEEAFEKHLHNMIKATGGVQTSGVGGLNQDPNSFDNKEVEFVSEEQKIEVINLDGNDSRSQSPDRDRYKRRRSSRSRSRDRGGRGSDRRRGRSRSRSRTRSPRNSQRRRSSRDRDRNKEKDREHERERRKKGLPDIRKEHLSVCSTTLWVGHLSKLVYQEELSDTFGEYGDIVSIDQIVPRGCAFIVMNRRQDAYKAMQSLKNCKLQGRAITISWAAGKGVKSKEWKDFWDLELGVTYVPWHKLDTNTDFDSLEEGGMFDEDSMPGWMKDKINQLKSAKEKVKEMAAAVMANASAMPPQPTPNMLFGIDTTQPPPGPPPHGAPPPPMMQMVPGQFQMAPPMGGPPRMLGGPMGMPLSGIPMPPNMVPGMPPPHMMMPAGMMPPGFPPMPGHGGPMGPPPMGMPPGQYPPPGPGPVNAPPAAATTVAPPFPSNHPPNDDPMDIEMDEDDAPSGVAQQQPPPMNFNQPPPPMMFGAVGGNGPSVAGGANEAALGGDIFSRDRNRAAGGGGAGSRWGGRGADDVDPQDVRWRENGAGPGGLTNFNGRPGGPVMNMPPMDLNNPDMVMNDFDNRGGQRAGVVNAVGGPRGGNGDFFQNVQPPNRFNQPTSLMQMRIPPPNSFGGPRMGGPGGAAGGGGPPGMFMRGQGPSGGRQQGPGFFNPRNPFDRDGARGSRGGGRGGRGGRSGGSQGNWSDEDEDGRGDTFKRRGGGNRFRDRDDSDEWHGGNRERGGGSRRGRHGRERDRDFRSGSRERRHASPADKPSSASAHALTPPQEVQALENWDNDADGKTPTAATASATSADASTHSTGNAEHDGGVIAAAASNNDQHENSEEATKEVPPPLTEKKKHNNPFAVATSTPSHSERPSQPAEVQQPAVTEEATSQPPSQLSTPPPPPPQPQVPQQTEQPQAIAPPVVEEVAHRQEPSPPQQQQQEEQEQTHAMLGEPVAAATETAAAAATEEKQEEGGA